MKFGDYMTAILEETDGALKFSEEVKEFILDEKMELKAVKLKNGQMIDHMHLHRHFSPRHPLIKTPTGLRIALDQLFLHEFTDRRLAY